MMKGIALAAGIVAGAVLMMGAAAPADWAGLPDRDGDGFPDRAELASHADRAAFRQWTCALALRQAEGGLPSTGTFRAAGDCADFMNIVYREALKRHDQRWRDRAVRSDSKSCFPSRTWPCS